jgi:hypothetical protein
MDGPDISEECLGWFLDPILFLLTCELITCSTCKDHYVIKD